MDWQVDVIQVGQWTAVPGPELYWMREFDHWEPLALLSVVLRNGAKTAVVNTGPAPDYLDYMNGIWRRSVRADCQLHVASDEHIEIALGRFGLQPSQVDYVICTPFQAYSVGNLDKFTTARICLSRRGWEFFHSNRYPNHPHDFRPMVFPSRILHYLIDDAWPRVRLLDDEDQIDDGLSVFWTGVHHRASIAVKVQTASGPVIITDCAFRYRNIEEDIPLGIAESIYEALEAYARIRREAAIVIPLYEQAVFERHPGGHVA